MDNVNFCSDAKWKEVIEKSQHHLFDTHFLMNCADEFREHFYGRKKPDSCYPKECHYRFPQGQEVMGMYAGYDLPLSITPKENFNGKHVLIMAQDPLRTPTNGSPKVFSIGCPWAYNQPRYHTLRHYGLWWKIIMDICRTGHGVWISDAYKLYFHKTRKQKCTRMLEKLTLCAETKSLAPIHMITLGAHAKGELTRMSAENSDLPRIDAHPHPTARGNYLQEYYGIDQATLKALYPAIKSQIARNSEINFLS